MSRPIDPITVTLPRTLALGIVELSDDLARRMHELLERNTDGLLNPAEQAELDTLVRIAQFGEIISSALKKAG